MEKLVSVYNDPLLPLSGANTDNMAVVADVHTDLAVKCCLEEGVGYPLEIFVIVNEGGTVRITRGAIFSYYEFIQPISERLTDEAWREMLAGDTKPSMPAWTASFMDITSSSPEIYSHATTNHFRGEFVSVETDGIDYIPAKIQLLQNYPNPFNMKTAIRFELPESAHVTLSIFNMLGQKIVTLHNGVTPPGIHTIVWNGKDAFNNDVTSGVYICRLKTESYSESRKLLLIK